MIDPLECRAKCPYFIRCGEVIIRFPSKGKRNKFAKQNCDAYFSSCFHRRLMDQLAEWAEKEGK